MLGQGNKMKEFKIVPWEKRQDLLDVIESRKNSKILKSSLNTNQSFIDNDINRLDIYSHNIVLGMYIDGVLDCFSYIHPWSELPGTYSCITYTRSGSEKRERYPNSKHSKSMVELGNNRLLLMESKGYYNTYALLQDVDYEPFYTNPDSRYKVYNIMVVERIEAGQISVSPLFRHRLSARTFDVPVQILFCSLPLELRNNDKPSN